MMRWLILFPVIPLVFLSWVAGELATPAQAVFPLQAVYSPPPVYRSEWVQHGVTGKAIVLVTIDSRTGIVTGTRMLQSTGNKLLDHAALKAYSKWRFKPGSVSQVKMPIDFASRPIPRPSEQAQKQPAILYVLLILIGLGAVVTVTRNRKTLA
jgi:TonB family protein